MKEKTNIKDIHRILSIIGLVVLLCLSPCKVRNYIQSEFGGLKTEASNKSQTTISNASCNIFEVVDATVNIAKPTFSHAATLAVNTVYFTSNTIDFRKKSINNFRNGSDTASFIPFYILFQNFKVYL